jgi:hypothetical protein
LSPAPSQTSGSPSVAVVFVPIHQLALSFSLPQASALPSSSVRDELTIVNVIYLRFLLFEVCLM